MLTRWRNAKDFFSRISNLANVHDQQGLKVGYNAIHSFYLSKMLVMRKKREHATKDLTSNLQNMYNMRMLDYLSGLKFRSTRKYAVETFQALTI